MFREERNNMTDKKPVKIEVGPRSKPVVPLVSSYRPKQCLERFWLDLVEDKSLRNEEDPFMVELAKLGNAHEARGQEHLEQGGQAARIECFEKTTTAKFTKMVDEARLSKHAIIVSDESGRGEQLAQHATHALCENPGEVSLIWNAHLRPWRKTANGYEWGGRSGKPDALVRDKIRGGAQRWNPVDYKAHRALEKTGKVRTWKTSPLTDHRSTSDHTAAGPFKESDAMQLAHYVEMLTFHGLEGNGTGGIVGVDFGQDAHTIVWVDLNEKLYDRGRKSAMELYAEKYAEARAVAECGSKRRKGEEVSAITRPEWKSECKTCVWREHFQERLIESDDTTLLAGVTVKVARALRECGVDTVAKLARLDIATAQILDHKVEELDVLVADARSMRQYANSPVGAAISGPDAKVEDVLVKHNVTTVGALAALDLETAKMPAGVNLVAHIDQARVVDYARRKKMAHIFRARGVHAVSIPRGNVEIHTDMEEDGIIYCWGNYLSWRNPSTGKLRTSYHAFVTFERTDAEEARVFAEYWAFLQEWQNKAAEKFGVDTFKVFHYTQAEDRCMRHLAKKHAGAAGVPSIEEVDAFLASEAWVDLYPILTKSLVWPTDDHSLKSLAKYVRFMWRDTDPSGANSTLWYQKASDPNLSDDERKIWQTRLLQYNEDDVQATAALVDFVDRFTKVYDMTKKLPPVEDLEPRYRRGALTKV